jgi:hypothetical protein
MERTLAKARKGSNRRGKAKTATARLKAKKTGRRVADPVNREPQLLLQQA